MMSFKIDSKFQPKTHIDNINKIKLSLNITKDKLDDIYKNYNYAGKYMQLFDPFHTVKYKISKNVNASNVTIAWLKGYEIISTFNLVSTNNNFVYFDNASFPGSFILAMNHYMKTIKNNTKKKIKWYASSLLTNTDINHAPLEDSYGLYKNYPDNWLMNSHNNGDISNIENIKDFQLQMEQKEGDVHSVDLYTCDLGMDVSNDYNNQELLHSYLNICQIFCGLSVLKHGGNLVVKHYTLFEPLTIKYLILLSQLFEKMYITKPLTSKRTNSEVYIVCKDFKKIIDGDHNSINTIYNLFMECVINKETSPIINFKISELFKNQQSLNNITQNIFNACDKIFTNQKISLNQYIYSVQNSKYLKVNTRYEKEILYTNNKIRNKFYKIPLLRINNNYNLHTIKKYYKDKKRYIV
jgi:23S rRNA U2552 (ribose-2'-O)-methylase RlmE/FtsJ